jgi:hypothetical protein
VILHHCDSEPRGSVYLSPHIRTLSDYPLLIGEVLRRNELRCQRRAKRALFARRIKQTFGMRSRE